MYGGVEAGGTRFICAVGDGPARLAAEARFPTTTPGETLGRVIRFFQEQSAVAPLTAIGVASFGPLDLEPASPTFGQITSTPKPGWAGADIAGALRRALGRPVAIDTDVNGAALAEFRWGAAQGQDPCLYMTVGTGIGVGGIVNGRPLHGLIHPEAGHIRIPHDWQADPFPGVCPFHGDCFEGLAAGPALRARWGRPAEMLPPDHPAWELEARYIALAAVNLICILSPRRLVIGGGVLRQPALLPRLREQATLLLHGYLQSPVILAGMTDYIVAPGLGSRAGILGALALAQDAA